MKRYYATAFILCLGFLIPSPVQSALSVDGAHTPDTYPPILGTSVGESVTLLSPDDSAALTARQRGMNVAQTFPTGGILVQPVVVLRVGSARIQIQTSSADGLVHLTMDDLAEIQTYLHELPAEQLKGIHSIDIKALVANDPNPRPKVSRGTVTLLLQPDTERSTYAINKFDIAETAAGGVAEHYFFYTMPAGDRDELVKTFPPYGPTYDLFYGFHRLWLTDSDSVIRNGMANQGSAELSDPNRLQNALILASLFVDSKAGVVRTYSTEKNSMNHTIALKPDLLPAYRTATQLVIGHFTFNLKDGGIVGVGPGVIPVPDTVLSRIPLKKQPKKRI